MHIQPVEEQTMENLARYIIRACFSRERMTYIPDESKMIYRSKDGDREQKEKAREIYPASFRCLQENGIDSAIF